MTLAARVELTMQTRVIAGLVAVAFLAGVFELVRRRRLQERYTVIWVFGGIALWIAALFPDALALVSRLLGIQDINAALFSLVLALLLSLCFHFTIVISRQSEQITRLAQDSAIERAELQMLRAARDAELAAPAAAQPAVPPPSAAPAGQELPAHHDLDPVARRV